MHFSEFGVKACVSELGGTQRRIYPLPEIMKQKEVNYASNPTTCMSKYVGNEILDEF